MRFLLRSFRLFKDAFLGKEEDYTQMGMNKAIFLLAVPMIAEFMGESLFALVDAYFVSNISEEAVATVGLTESLMTIVYSLGFGLAMGATAMIARRIGEKKAGDATQVAIQAIYIVLSLSIVISVIGLFFAEDLLGLMGAEQSVIDQGAGYTRWMLGGNFVIMLLFLNNGSFRGAGDASIAMRALWLANLINIGLDPLLIFGWGPIPGFGIEGAAYATNIGRGLGVCLQLWFLFGKSGHLKPLREHFTVHTATIIRLIKLAAGGTGQFIIASASWIFLVRIMSNFGSEALAGYTIGIRVLIFTLLPAWGMSNAATTLVGQNLGAKQPDKAEQSVWRTGSFMMIFMVIVTVYYWFNAEFVLSFFPMSPEAIHHGIECLRYISLGYIFYGWGMVLTQAFNGAGDTRTPTILNFIGFWLMQIPFAYLLAVQLGMGPIGIYIAVASAESALAIMAMVVFKRGKWKLINV